MSERVVRREFVKVFSGKELIPILSWGINVFFTLNIKYYWYININYNKKLLKLTLGLVDSGTVNVNKIKLRDHFGVFFFFLNIN